jgi:hypothetical protein
MRLYTICVHGCPVVVISTDTVPPMLDEFTTNAKLMQANRETEEFIDSLPDEVRRIGQRQEIDEAIDTWLGEDLIEWGWSGDHAALHVRDATTDEAGRWHISRQAAIDADAQEAGDEGWVIFVGSKPDGLSGRRKPN